MYFLITSIPTHVKTFAYMYRIHMNIYINIFTFKIRTVIDIFCSYRTIIIYLIINFVIISSRIHIGKAAYMYISRYILFEVQNCVL